MDKGTKTKFKQRIFSYMYDIKGKTSVEKLNKISQRIADDVEIYVEILCNKIKDLEKKNKKQ